MEAWIDFLFFTVCAEPKPARFFKQAAGPESSSDELGILEDDRCIDTEVFQKRYLRVGVCLQPIPPQQPRISYTIRNQTDCCAVHGIGCARVLARLMVVSRLCPNIALSLPSCCLVIPMPWKRKRNWAADACCYHNAHHNSMDICDQEVALPRGAGSNRRQGRHKYHAVPTTFSSAREYLRPLLGRTLLFPAAPHQKFPVQNRLAVSERHCSRRELTTNSRCSDCVQNTSERPPAWKPAESQRWQSDELEADVGPFQSRFYSKKQFLLHARISPGHASEETCCAE